MLHCISEPSFAIVSILNSWLGPMQIWYLGLLKTIVGHHNKWSISADLSSFLVQLLELASIVLLYLLKSSSIFTINIYKFCETEKMNLSALALHDEV